jgi:hypothetical protein
VKHGYTEICEGTPNIRAAVMELDGVVFSGTLQSLSFDSTPSPSP